MKSLVIAFILLTTMTILFLLLLFVWFVLVTIGLLLCAETRGQFVATILVSCYFFYNLFVLAFDFV